MENEATLKERYARHLMLDDVGQEGQDKLSSGRVLIIGAGGLGSPVCLYLSAAGVGRIGILDFDTVEISNLQRQVIHYTSDVGKSKISSAQAKMSNINPNVKIDTYFEKLTESNAADILQNYDFIIDATDNFTGKFLINRICVGLNKPFSHAGVLKYRGQTMTVIPHKSACFSCVFSEQPSSELDSYFRAGLFGVTPGIIGCIQASEAIKYILGIGDLLLDSLLTMDIKTMSFRKVAIKPNPHCNVCSNS